jgi:HSP20 family molecular chaperone IbpA
LNLYLINSGISMRLSKVPTWTPPAEIYEDSQEYVVRVELSGLTEDDVTVHQINNILIVRGTRTFKRASEDAQYHSTERVYGTFERLFPLPNYVQPDSLQTSLSDGIFEIRLAKLEAAKGAAEGKETGAHKGGAQARSAAAHKSSQESGQEKERKR